MSLIYTARSKKYFNQLSTLLNNSLTSKDLFTYIHGSRVPIFLKEIGKQVKIKHDLSELDVELISLYGYFHDIGKVYIDDTILTKPDKLSPEERNIVQQHPILGYNKIKENISNVDTIIKPEILCNIVLQHHEFIDGSGYPYGLKGEEISTEAKMVTVVDIYDALTSIRPYNRVFSNSEAIEYLQKQVAAGKLEHDFVEALKKVVI